MVGERLRLLFCDHLSLARGKYLPASKIGNGSSRFCQGTFAVTYDKELVPAPGGTMLEGLPDMDAVYVEEDIREGWEPNTKVVLADLCRSDGKPLALCGRSLLKRTVKQWHELGYSPMVGLELGKSQRTRLPHRLLHVGVRFAAVRVHAHLRRRGEGGR
jgi:glutamine synthetase